MNQSANADDCGAELALVDPEEPEEEVRNHKLIPLYSRRGLRSSSAQDCLITVIMPKRAVTCVTCTQNGGLLVHLCTKRAVMTYNLASFGTKRAVQQ